MLSLSYWSSCTHHTQDELDRVLLSEDTETIKQHLSGLACISTSKLYKKVVSVYALPNWAKDILAVKWDIVVTAHLKGTSPRSSYFKKHLRYKFPVVKKGRAFDFLVNVLQVNIGSSSAENLTQSSRVSSSFKQNTRWPKASLRPRLDIIAHLQKIDQDHLKLHLSVIQETPITSWCKIVCSRLAAPKWVDVHLNNALQNFKRNPHYEKLQGVHALYFKAKENETFVTAGQSYYVLNLLLRSEYDDEDTESDNDDCSIIDLRSKETNSSQQTEHECIDDSEDDNGSSSSSSSFLSNKNCMICKKDPWCMGCQDCELNLCEQCWQMLHTSPKISEHVRAEPLDCEHRICPSHPSMYVVALCTDASCSLSNKLMCALCDEHKSHSHMSLKSGYEFYTHKLGNQLKSTMATLQRVKRMKSQFESTNIIDDIKTKRHRITLLRSLFNRSEITRREESCNSNNAMIDARAENNIKSLHCGASKINNLFPTAQSALRAFIHAKTASTSRIAIFRDYTKFAKSLDDRPLIVETDHLHHSFVEYQKTPIPDNGWTIPNFSRLINVQPTQKSERFAQLYGRILVTMFPEGVITDKPSIRFDFVDRRNINSTHWAYTFKLLVYVVHKNSSESISHTSSCAFTSTIARIDVSSRFIIDRILQDQEGFLHNDDKLDIDVVLQEDSLWNV